jgi:hypothetical protein
VRWVGIDEAGYGPNIGPLVMTAVIAEDQDATAGPPPDLWLDLAPAVDRAGGAPDRLWIDDSKAILRGGKGRDRLETTCMALLDAIGTPLPRDAAALLDALDAGTLHDAELHCWCDEPDLEPGWPGEERLELAMKAVSLRPLIPPRASWRLAAVRSVVLGPAEFNRRLGAMGSKAAVHYSAFQALLRRVWEQSADVRETRVEGDKHGGRHYYYSQLVETFPGAWIERGVEGPSLSQYAIVDDRRRMRLSLRPRADAGDGLVALASIVSKTVREIWMDRFNAYWARRLPGLRPTAGYPVDAARFRREIEAMALAQGFPPELWWRAR